MISPPIGWAVHQGVRELLFEHPDGLAAGAIRYQQRFAPLAPLGALVARALAQSPQLEDPDIGEPRPIVTHEGEHAVVVTVDGTAASKPARLVLGFLLIDESCDLVSSLAVDPTRFAATVELVDQLASGATFSLGCRPRRALYDRPSGWHGIARGLMTEWYAPEAPRDPAIICVWPAIPRTALPPSWWLPAVEPSDGFERAGVQEALASNAGLEGKLARFAADVDGVAIARTVAVLADDRYAYPLRLDALADGADDHQQALVALIDTLQPIPPSHGARASLDAAFEHWGL